ncbi:TPA: hypothetical protein MFN02_005533 [Klebsiella pneumoniae]|nr:hypothetical protein [Klebsiella pneumoniae]
MRDLILQLSKSSIYSTKPVKCIDNARSLFLIIKAGSLSAQHTTQHSS